MALPTLLSSNLPQAQTGLKAPLNLSGYGISTAPSSTAISSNPSATATNSVLKTPAAQQYTQSLSQGSGITNPSLYYGNSTGTPTFDTQGRPLTPPQTAYTPPAGSPAPVAPYSPVTQNPAANPAVPAAPVPSQSTPTSDALSTYLSSLTNTSGVTNASNAYNDYIANQSKSVAGLSGRGFDIPLSIVQGEQAKLLAQTNPEATRLQNAIGIAQTAQDGTQSAAKAAYDAYVGEQTAQNTANQQTFDNGIKTQTLNLQQQNAADAQNKPVSVSPGSSLFDPSTGKVLFTAPTALAQTAGISANDAQSLLSTLNDYNGTKYLTPTDLTGYSSAEKNAIVSSLKNAGIQTLSAKDATQVDSIQTAKSDLQDLMTALSSSTIQPKDWLGRPYAQAQATLGSWLQANNSSALDTFNATALPLLSALRSGGGGSSRLFTSITSLLPNKTDTVSVAQGKMDALNKLLDNGASSIIGGKTDASSNGSSAQNTITAPDGTQVIITD